MEKATKPASALLLLAAALGTLVFFPGCKLVSGDTVNGESVSQACDEWSVDCNPATGTLYPPALPEIEDSVPVSTTADTSSEPSAPAVPGYVYNPDATVVSFGQATSYNTVNKNPYYNIVRRINETKFIVAYVDYGDGGAIKASVATINGSTVSVGPANTLKAGNLLSFDIAVLSESRAVMAFKNEGNSHAVACQRVARIPSCRSVRREAHGAT